MLHAVALALVLALAGPVAADVFEAGGGFGSTGELVRFHGIGVAVVSGSPVGSVTAPEPPGVILIGLGLAGALQLRRRVSGSARG